MTAATYDCHAGEDVGHGISAAAAAIRRGDLVVIPTDTVYGVAADAFHPPSVNLLLAAKGRGRDMPVPVLVSSTRMLQAVVDGLPDLGRRLTAELWPGALTIVVRHTPHLAWDLGEARGTVAVRMPDHPLALDLIEQTGPLAVSSANRTGQPPATTAAAALEQLADSVAVYLDAGPCAGGVPSTIVDLTGEVPRVLRVGAVPTATLTDLGVPAE